MTSATSHRLRLSYPNRTYPSFQHRFASSVNISATHSSLVICLICTRRFA
ncbi:hypothetical protein PMIN01_01317 [Paraphaeosphaeria minitans]|uniref:Uncharacterized protein n=1 Tax=Paraphaeosphaeria minitans TaxID=565426 RepID=A0A9P6GV19_9PLEO|nr:hypothetical protein PMIN01_01317 [Paraphaeosphaeria minitans]